MTPHSRRTFLGTVLAMPILPAVGFAQKPAPAVTDPFLIDFAAELQRVVASIETNPAGAARQHASLLRVLAGYRAPELDAQVRKAIRDALRTRGREALIYDELPLPALRGGKQLPPPPFDAQVRGQALDLVLAEGWTQSLKRQAKLLDDIAPRLAQLRPAQLQMLNPEDPCLGMNRYYALLEITAGSLCLLTLAGVPEPCAIATINMVGYRTYMWFYGCY